MIVRRGMTFEYQDAFGIWFVLATFFLGMGAGLFILSVLYGFILGKLVGLIFVLLELLFLGIEAGHPLRVWKAFGHPRTSWLSRGLIGLSVFLILAIISILQGYKFLPLSDVSTVGRSVNVVAVIVAAFLILYGSMIVARYPSIPAWHSILVPSLFVSYGLTSGTAILFFLYPLVNMDPIQLGQTGLIVILINLILLLMYWIELSLSSTAAKESARIVTRGKFWPYFIIGVVVVGSLIPVILIAGQIYSVPERPTILFLVAGVLSLMGSFLFRCVLLKIGIYEIPT
jgi:formate-dependent nitrite reductase membrane component NrfD